MHSGDSPGFRFVKSRPKKAFSDGFSKFSVATPSTPSRTPQRLPDSHVSVLGTQPQADLHLDELATTPSPASRSILQNMSFLPTPPASNPATPIPAQRAARKRKHDENMPPDGCTPPSPITRTSPASMDFVPGAPMQPSYPMYAHHLASWGSMQQSRTGYPEVTDTREKRRHLSDVDKLSMFLDHLYDDLGWTLGDLLYMLFNHGLDMHRERRHAAAVSAFLQGRCRYKPVHILDLWMRHPDGTSSVNDSEFSRMYSTCPKDLDASLSVRVALTCFAARTVAQELVREAEKAILPENGMHAMRKRRKLDPDGITTTIHWEDVGAVTMSRVSEIVGQFQPLLQELLLYVADRDRDKKRAADGGAPSRKRRPADLVVTNVISTLDFSRSNRANLLPIARGLLHFALSAPYDVFLYLCRIGVMPAYTTIYRCLEALAKQEEKVVHALGKDPKADGYLVSDNIQNILVQRDPAIGRVTSVNIGMAATYIEAPRFPTNALDFDDKQDRIKKNARASLTVSDLFGLIDQRHLENVGILFLLRTLINTIPELSSDSYRRELSLRYSTRGAKLRLDPEAAKIHPLGTSAKKETVTTELKEAFVDFLQQAGQEPGNYNRQLVLMCGDGLTFEKTVQIKRYLQFHPDPFESFALIEPILAPWHTVWTDLSRIFSTFWGEHLSKDPSTLAFAAAKIGRRAPSNLSKPDFESALQILEVVHDARILDCFRIHFGTEDIFTYFTGLATSGMLPTFEKLEQDAKAVYRAYCTHRAGERALEPVGDLTGEEEELSSVLAWKASVPLGSVWTPKPDSTSQASVLPGLPAEPPNKGKGRKRARKTNGGDCKRRSGKAAQEDSEKDETTFLGDRVLANAINFMNDALVTREFLCAVAEGDPGRVYEAMKIMLFTFAGSSHSKYTTYLLEFIIATEYESSAELRESILRSLVVNLSGTPGHFSPVDLIQEYLNRLLQAIAERKGAEYNGRFLRNIVSRNLHHLARLSNDMKDGVGLAERPGRHTDVKHLAELRILLKAYQDEQLHYRRSGHSFVQGALNTAPSDFRQGVANLRNGKLNKFQTDSSYMRGTSTIPNSSHFTTPAAGSSVLSNVESAVLGEADLDLDRSDATIHTSTGEGLVAFEMDGARLRIRRVDIEDDARRLMDSFAQGEDSIEAIFGIASDSDTTMDDDLEADVEEEVVVA